jgi:hypothetical protein
MLYLRTYWFLGAIPAVSLAEKGCAGAIVVSFPTPHLKTPPKTL